MSERVFILAFDHRVSLMRSFFGVEGAPTGADGDRARTAKGVIWRGLQRAIETGPLPSTSAGALVDATYGARVIAEARERFVRVAVPVEASGRRDFAFESPDWRERLGWIPAPERARRAAGVLAGVSR